MKRKPPAPSPQTLPTAQVEDSVPVFQDRLWLETLKVVLFSVLLFLAMTVRTGRMSVILCMAALLCTIPVGGAVRRLRIVFCVPVMGFLAFGLSQGLAAVYSPFGVSAVAELSKLLAAFALGVILLTRFERKHIPALLWGFATVSAAIGLLSVDMTGAGWIFQPFEALMNALGSSFEGVQLYTGSFRVAGLYNDANVSASLFALGALLSLYLLSMAGNWKTRVPAALLAGVNSMAVLLSASRAALLCLGLAGVVWLLIEPKGRKTALFLRAIVLLVCTGALSVLSMREMAGSGLPLLLTTVSGVPLALLDPVLARLSGWLSARRRFLLAGCAALCCTVIAFGAVALSLTEPVQFTEELTYVNRGMALAPGTYTLSAEGEGELTVTVLSRTKEQALVNGYSLLYRGDLSEAAFTVEDEDVWVTFTFYGGEGAVLEAVNLPDGTEIPMIYQLLPAVLVDRMQSGTFRDYSFLVRLQFMKDAWTLFLQSPLIGHGLGSTENLYPSVQPFFYESLYVHNHILQYLSDSGLVGLTAFLVLVLGGLWLLLQKLRDGENAPLAAALIACWVMINVHGFMEINFSVRGYLCFALPLLLLPALAFGQPLTGREFVLKWGGRAMLMTLCAVEVVFGGLFESHRMVEREAEQFSASSVYEYLDAWADWLSRDVFVREQYALDFVGNAVLLKDPGYNGDMKRYASELRTSGTYTACSGLAKYYYLPRGEYEDVFACSREGIAQQASRMESWNLQMDFYRTDVLSAITLEDMEVYMRGVLDLKECLEAYSLGRLDTIELTEENQAFLTLVSSAQDSGIPTNQLYMLLLSQNAAPTEES